MSPSCLLLTNVESRIALACTLVVMHTAHEISSRCLRKLTAHENVVLVILLLLLYVCPRANTFHSFIPRRLKGIDAYPNPSQYPSTAIATCQLQIVYLTRCWNVDLSKSVTRIICLSSFCIIWIMDASSRRRS